MHFFFYQKQWASVLLLVCAFKEERQGTKIFSTPLRHPSDTLKTWFSHFSEVQYACKTDKAECDITVVCVQCHII